MADRSVVVRLRAEVASYVAGLKQAQAATTQLGKEISDQGKSASADVQRIGTASVVAGGLVVAGFAKMINTSANFEKELSGVKAVSGATTEQMHSLSDAALAAGASTKLAGVTASDAARAEAELVKAGVSVSDTLGGALMGSLTLAAAGQLDFADAATIAAQAMNIFNLSGQDVSHVADVLAAAANKSAGDVGQFGDALRQGGLVAKQTGLSLEDTVGTLAAFADNALIGSDAGTSLKTMLQRLTPQSKEAANLMDELGFSAYDAQGNFIGLEGLAGELQTSLGGLTQEQRNTAMATLFGSDAVRAANILYEEGAAGIQDYVKAVDDQGAAARMAAIQNDNLKGDVEALGGAIESALIENGSKGTGALRALTQGATDMVASFSDLPGVAQSITVGLGGLVGVASLAGGGFITMAPKVKASSDALKEMDSVVAQFAGNNLGKLAGGLAGLTVAVGAGVFLYGKATQSSREYEASVKELATALEPVTKGQATLNDVVGDFFDARSADMSTGAISAMNAFGVSLDDVQRSIKGGGDALDPLRESFKALGYEMGNTDLGKLDDIAAPAGGSLDEFAKSLGLTTDDIKELIDATEQWDEGAQASAHQSIESATANDTFSKSAVDAAAAAFKAKDGSTNWVAVLDYLSPKVAETGTAASEAAGGITEMAEASDDAEQKAKDLKEAIEKLMAPLDTSAAIDQFSSGINDMAQHFADADAEVGEAQDNMRDRQERLNELLSMKKEDRGDGWAGQVQDAKDAIVDAQARIDEAIAGTSRTLEGNGQAAIDNRDILRDMASDAADAIEQAAADQTMSIGDVISLRDSMIMQMEAEAERVGLNKDVVATYTEVLRNIPLDITTKVAVTGADAVIGEINRIQTVLDRYTAQGTDTTIAAQQSEQMLVRQYRNQRAQGKAAGGLIYAAQGAFIPQGTDTVPVMATPGEFMMQAAAVDRYGVSFMEALNAGTLPLGGGSGGTSYDHSRTSNWQPVFNMTTRSPQDAAGAVSFRLRRHSLEMAG